MKKIFITAVLGYLAYLFTFHVVFLPNIIYEFVFVFISGVSLVASFYFYLKKKHIGGIISIIIFALNFSLSYLLQVFFRMKDYTYYVYIYWILLIFSIISFGLYFYYYMQQLYYEEINNQNYLHQIENEINENYIHVLRHDYNQKLYQIINDVKVNNKEQALIRLNNLMKDSYQNNAITISNSSSLNHMFQLQQSLYHNEGIPFQYYLCRVDKASWNDKYTIFIYKFLEAARVLGNEIVFYMQINDNSYICKIVSHQPVLYQHFLSNVVSINETLLSKQFVYTMKLPFSS